VRLGVRRVHALPTPISSYHLMGGDAHAQEQLASSGLLAQLVQSMQARVIRHAGLDAARDALDAGICVLPLDDASPAAIGAAVARGARRVLCIAPGSTAPVRMLLQVGDEIPRTELLALASSVMRHLPIPVSAVTLQPAGASEAESSAAARVVQDTRSELRGAYGLDLRSERHVGDLPGWVGEVTREEEPTLLVLGLRGTPDLATRLAGELRALFSAGGQVAVLLAIGNGRQA
jgi:hypothetical protein